MTRGDRIIGPGFPSYPGSTREKIPPPTFINQGFQGQPAANKTLGWRFGPVPEQQRWFLDYLAVDSTPNEIVTASARIYIEDDKTNAQGRIYGILHSTKAFFGPLIIEPGQVLAVYYSGIPVNQTISSWIWGYAYDSGDGSPFFRSGGSKVGAGGSSKGSTIPVEYGCLLELAATINIPNATLVTIGGGGANGVWNSIHEEPSGITWFDPATGIITVPNIFSGLNVVCAISASFHWTNNFVGQRRQLNVLINGTTESRSDHFPMASDMFTAPAHVLTVQAGDQIQWQVYQDGGGTNPLNGGAGVGTACDVTVLGVY